MKIILGLGNPGEEYKDTRHNLGFRLIDAIIKNPNFKFQNLKLIKKFKSEISENIFDNKKILLIKPQTFMNNSGIAIQKIVNFYKIKLKDLIVIHDDIDLPLGTIKISFGEGAAGHKGVLSIISSLGSKDFWRIRIGILNKPKEDINVEKFVLEKFTKKDEEIVKRIINKITEEIKEFLKGENKAKKIFL